MTCLMVEKYGVMFVTGLLFEVLCGVCHIFSAPEQSKTDYSISQFIILSSNIITVTADLSSSGNCFVIHLQVYRQKQ